MIKFLFFLSFTYIALGFPSSNAAVRRITNVKSFGSFSVGGNSDVSFKQNNKTLCADAGYTLTSCPENQIAQDVCPFDARYFNSCKCNQNHFSVTDSKDCGRFTAFVTLVLFQ